MQADQEFVEKAPLEEEIVTETSSLSQEESKISSPDYKQFLLAFEESKEVEEKIRKAVEFMRSRLSSGTSPRFKEFWEVRKLCLPLFKESLAPKVRSELWQQYVDLSVEARRLKEILDEQSAFAYEQIDLAIQALTTSLSSQEELLAQIADLEELKEARSLQERKESYVAAQRELDFLNDLAAKVNALRKEVVKTDMRIRSKNKLFERLSACGDQIFPRRKELIRKVSQEFLEDVETFTGQQFVEGKEPTIPLHSLREEIKALQALAKRLTLNTHAFTEARVKLSHAWDLLKEWERERRKEFVEKKAKYEQNFGQADLLVKEFEEFCGKEEDLASVDKKQQEIFTTLRTLEMGRSEIKVLRDRMDAAKKPLEEKRRAEIEKQQEKEKANEEARLQKVQAFRSELQTLVEESESLSAEAIAEKKTPLEEAYKALSATKAEKALLDRLFRQLKDRMLEARGRSLLSLSDDEQEQYEGLKAVLREKKERRQEMKNQIETYRKMLGGSSLDFERAMTCRELMETEKQGLEKINADIEEIEGKISQLEG